MNSNLKKLQAILPSNHKLNIVANNEDDEYPVWTWTDESNDVLQEQEDHHGYDNYDFKQADGSFKRGTSIANLGACYDLMKILVEHFGIKDTVILMSLGIWDAIYTKVEISLLRSYFAQSDLGNLIIWDRNKVGKEFSIRGMHKEEVRLIFQADEPNTILVNNTETKEKYEPSSELLDEIFHYIFQD